MSQARLRVLMVTPVAVVGGAENMFLQIAALLPGFDVDPELVCMRPGPLVDKAKAAGLAVHVYKEHRYRNVLEVMKAVRWLSDLVRDREADLMHCNHTGHLYSGLARRRTGVPEVWHLHDYDNPRDWVQKIIRRIAPSHVIFATNVLTGGFPDLMRYPHTVIQPTCVDVRKLLATPDDPYVLQKFSLPEKPILLTVARMQPHKGHRILIDAAAQVARAIPDVTFAIIGKASGAEQQAYLQELEEKVGQLDLRNTVRFLGFVGDDDLVNLYRRAAAVVHPATSEGFSVTLQEAMAAGAPVIATSADGPRELLETWKTGVVVPAGNSVALAEAIVALLKDPARAAVLRDKGMRAAQAARVETMVQRTAEVYRQVVASNGAKTEKR